jgi:hypothetical protein
MDKPAVFLSHSTVDAKPLGLLRELLDRKTGGTLALFLSSDGQSIPLGRNWVHAVQEALETCQLMFVFITPSSQQSSWLFFEAGFAYSKNTRVVPVAMFGLDLRSVAPPLSLLQGFNVTSAAGLNNVIAVINTVFNHKHAESFNDGDYDAVVALSDDAFAQSGGAILDRVGRIEVKFAIPKESTPEDFSRALSEAKVDHVRNEDSVEIFGGVFEIDRSYGDAPSAAIAANVHQWPAVTEAIGAVLRAVAKSDAVQVLVKFDDAVRICGGRTNVTARLAGSPVSLEPDHFFGYQGHRFFIERVGGLGLMFRPRADQISQIPIHSIVRLLFERKVLSANVNL